MCLVISEIPVRIKRVGRHRRIPIRLAGNLLPEEAHRALERDALHHALLARVPTRQDADLAHRLVHDVEARLLIRFLQKLGDAVKLVQQPALANPALVGSGYFSPRLLQRLLETGIAVVQVIKPPLQVAELALIASVGGVKRVNLVHEHAHALVVSRLLAPDALGVLAQLLHVGLVVDAAAQCLHERVRTRRQLHHLYDLGIHVLLRVLAAEGTGRPTRLRRVRAVVRVGGLSPRAVLLDLSPVRVRGHLAPALRAHEQPVQQVHVPVVVPLGVRLPGAHDCLGGRPGRLVDDCLVPAVVDLVPVALHHVRLAARALDDLGAPAPVGNLADVHGIDDHPRYRGVPEGLHGRVAASGLRDAVPVQPRRYRHRPLVLVGVHLEDAPNDLRLVLIDHKLLELAAPVHEPITVRGLPAVPVALAGLLLASAHGLGADVVALHLGEHGGDGKHRLAHRRGGVDAVLNAAKLHAVILEHLERVPRVGGIAPEARQLEHEHVRRALARLLLDDVIEHLAELWSPAHVLAGEARVHVLPEHAHAVHLGVPGQLESLGVYRLALLDLELGRYADVKDAGEGTGDIWVLGIFSCHIPALLIHQARPRL